MNEESVIITSSVLEAIFQEFTEFIRTVSGEEFVSFKTSSYINEQENYKYSIYQQAKLNLKSKNWKPEDAGTGRIQKAVDSAILKKVIHNGKPTDNNLIYWMQKDNFSKLEKNKNLEKLFFDFYKNKIPPQKAFQEFTAYFDYQLIAYLFFISNKDQFLPISQKTFDKIISEKLNISDFKTSGQLSWENYKSFLGIIKQAHKFLRIKIKDAELLDAHSFLWILGRQREDWLAEQTSDQVYTIGKDEIPGASKSLKVKNESIQTDLGAPEKNQDEIKEIESEETGITKLFTPADIIWVKNVTDHVVGQAYMKLTGDELEKFVLLFPDQHKNNILSPQVGEIILLRQYVNGVSAFTHLVAPIDDELVEENIHPGFSFGRNVQVIAMTPMDDLILASSTNWKDIFTRGNAVRIENIYKSGAVDNLQLSIWERFKPYFVNAQKQSLNTTSRLLIEIEHSDDNLTVTEGKLRLVAHMARERNSEIVRIKKQKAVAENALFCEVCRFSFLEVYNVEFIECHHRTPIAQTGETETTLEDLALVCANCHRMLHKKINGHFPSIDELKTIYRLKNRNFAGNILED